LEKTWTGDCIRISITPNAEATLESSWGAWLISRLVSAHHSTRQDSHLLRFLHAQKPQCATLRRLLGLGFILYFPLWPFFGGNFMWKHFSFASFLFALCALLPLLSHQEVFIYLELCDALPPLSSLFFLRE
jgi:hypothetical protein